MNNKPNTTTPHSDAHDELEVKRIEARLEDRRLIEKGLHLVEQAVMFKYIAAAKFASFSPAKQQRVTARMTALDAALLELATAFEAEREHEKHPTPRTFEEAIAAQQADDASDATVAS
jgi:hypothetical protein